MCLNASSTAYIRINREREVYQVFLERVSQVCLSAFDMHEQREKITIG